MNVTEALTYIHSVCWKGSIPGLSRTKELLARMGNPEKRLRFVHIAGTNGKGSTAAMIASVLQKAGYRTGLYTSPYLFRFHERMKVNGEDITDGELAEITQWVKPHAEAMEDHPTEFELVTAIAMEYFARQRCDIVVLEVGMGGEWDSTNVIDPPEAAVICNLGLDHTEVLGDTLEKIARAKAGIIKPGCPVVLYRNIPSVEAVFEAACRERGAELYKVDFQALHAGAHSFMGQTFDFGARTGLQIPLLGAHQLCNAAVAVTAVDCLIRRGWRISEENIRQGLRDVTWPGRFELLRRSPDFIVDGGHNPQCLEALAQNVRDYLAGRDITALTCVMADKDYTHMYATMAPLVSRFVTVTPDNPRAMAAEKLREILLPFGKPVTACASVAEGVEQAIRQAGEQGLVLAFGSLYLVGDVRKTVLEHSFQ